MKKIKRKLLISTFFLLMLFCSSIGLIASWSGFISLTLPNWGGFVDSYTYITKTSSSSTFSVYGVSECRSSH